MSENHAITVNGLSKKFARSLKRGMVYGLSDMAALALVPRRWRSPHQRARMADTERDALQAPAIHIPTDDELRPTEFWALRNVSFTMERGESIGLLGANGAGKSTLFSVLSGIYSPTYGSVRYEGRLQALIALGAGFHPALTGRENLYINAAILGLKEKEVAKIYDKILDFANIGSFIDAPIRNYSSGMVVRLAFSIAVHLDPDILLIDEVLAVGDAAFQLKCARYARELVSSGKTIVVVSHNMLIIQMMCRRVLWMDHGQILQDGDTHQITRDYQQFMLKQSAAEDDGKGKSNSRFRGLIHGIEWLDESGRPCEKLTWGKPHVLALDIEAFDPLEHARLWVDVGAIGKEGMVMGVSMYDDGHYMNLSKGSHRIFVRWDNLPLAQDNLFQVKAGIRDWTGQIMLVDSYASKPFEMNLHGKLCNNGEVVDDKCQLMSPLTAVPYRWEVTSGVELKSIGSPSTSNR